MNLFLTKKSLKKAKNLPLINKQKLSVHRMARQKLDVSQTCVWITRVHLLLVDVGHNSSNGHQAA